MSQLSDLNPREQFLLKFDDSNTTLEEVLQWESLVDEYKQGQPKVHKFINNYIVRLIQMMTIEGPPNDQLRSLLYPRIACEILSSGHPTVNILLLTPTTSSLNSQPLCSVLDYFQGTPNTILSGYVVRVLFAVYEHEPVKSQDFIFRRNYAPQMIKFTSSRSVADFIVSLVAIEDDRILTYYINERNNFLNQIADVYVEGNMGEEELTQLGYAICEILKRLWTQKCKEAGEFAGTVFRISQLILDNTNDLIRHNSDLLPFVIEKFVEQGSETPFIMKQCANRIINFLSTFQPQIWTAPSGKQTYRFSKQNLKLLTALSSIITKNYSTVAVILNNSKCFDLLLSLVQRYELNNMVHIEVEKIFKTVIKSDTPIAYTGFTQSSNVLQKIHQIVFCVQTPNQISKKAYIGSLTNILQTLHNSINTSKIFSQLKKSHPQFVNTLEQFIGDKSSKTSINLAGCKLKLEYAIPDYNESILQKKFKEFFEAQKIEKDPRQMENRYILNEIFNECAINKQWGQNTDETTATKIH